MKTKARDLIHGWPWPHSTSRPWPSTPTPLMQIQILNPPEIPAEVWTYLRLANDAMNDLTGAPIKMWAGADPHARTVQGEAMHQATINEALNLISKGVR